MTNNTTTSSNMKLKPKEVIRLWDIIQAENEESDKRSKAVAFSILLNHINKVLETL